MDLSHSHQFLASWLRNPRQAGALLPSGQSLARAMALHADLNRTVVEFGAGTGAITRALLARGLAPDRLVVIEKDPALCRILMQQFPGIIVQEGDVTNLAALLDKAGVERPGSLISSLPLVSMNRRLRQQLLEQVCLCMDPGSPLVQFTYSPRSPIPPTLQEMLGLQGQRVCRVPLNLPPAAVWGYRKPAESPAC